MQQSSVCCFCFAPSLKWMFVRVRVGGYSRELGSFFLVNGKFGCVSSKHSARPLNFLARHCSFFPRTHLVANSACYRDHCCKRLKVKHHFWESRGWDNKKLTFSLPCISYTVLLCVGWRSDRARRFSCLGCGHHVRAARDRCSIN